MDRAGHLRGWATFLMQVLLTRGMWTFLLSVVSQHPPVVSQHPPVVSQHPPEEERELSTEYSHSAHGLSTNTGAVPVIVAKQYKLSIRRSSRVYRSRY
jgi:hypothetical protein